MAERKFKVKLDVPEDVQEFMRRQNEHEEPDDLPPEFFETLAKLRGRLTLSGYAQGIKVEYRARANVTQFRTLLWSLRSDKWPTVFAEIERTKDRWVRLGRNVEKELRRADEELGAVKADRPPYPQYASRLDLRGSDVVLATCQTCGFREKGTEASTCRLRKELGESAGVMDYYPPCFCYVRAPELEIDEPGPARGRADLPRDMADEVVQRATRGACKDAGEMCAGIAAGWLKSAGDGTYVVHEEARRDWEARQARRGARGGHATRASARGPGGQEEGLEAQYSDISPARGPIRDPGTREEGLKGRERAAGSAHEPAGVAGVEEKGLQARDRRLRGIGEPYVTRKEEGES